MSAPTRWPNDIGRGEPQPLTEADLDRHLASRAPGRYLHTRPAAERDHIAGQAAQRWNVMAAERAASADWCDTVPTRLAPMAAEPCTEVGAEPPGRLRLTSAGRFWLAYLLLGSVVGASVTAFYFLAKG